MNQASDKSTNNQYRAGMKVIDSEGKSFGKVSNETESGFLVVDRPLFAGEQVVSIPLAAVAGAQDDEIVLYFTQEELLGRHKATPANPQPTTTADAVAQQVRPPLTEIARLTHKFGEKPHGDTTGHLPGLTPEEPKYP